MCVPMKYLTLASLAAFGLALAVQTPAFAQNAGQIVTPKTAPTSVENTTKGASEAAKEAVQKKKTEKKTEQDAKKKAKQ